MGLAMFTAATTSCVTNNGGNPYNSLQDLWLKESKYPRQVARIGLAGSAAAGDIRFQLYFGERLVAILFPTSVGNVYPDDDDMLVLSGGEVCPPGVEMRLLAANNSTTNPVRCIMETKELVGKYRRSS